MTESIPITVEPTPAKYTPDEEIEALIRAGLGDVKRSKITPEMHARAMRGEIVRPYEAAAEVRRRAAYKSDLPPESRLRRQQRGGWHPQEAL